MKTLLLAEHDGAHLKPATAKALTAACQLGAPVHMLVAGQECDAVAKEAATLSGVETVLVAQAPWYAPSQYEGLADLLVSLAPAYSTFVAAGTVAGKAIMPRVAALLDVMQVSEVIRVISSNTFERLIYAGNAVQTVQTTDAKHVLTIRTTAFPAAANDGSASMETVSAQPDPGLSQFQSAEKNTDERPDLASANTVVTGGRALGSKDNFETLIAPLADALHAAIGATRAAVDAGYAPNDWQVGQTGQVVAPRLYIALGVSGAIQHLSGMRDAGTIVAINTDPEAPIFHIADYALVADLFTAIPELIAALKANEM